MKSRFWKNPFGGHSLFLLWPRSSSIKMTVSSNPEQGRADDAESLEASRAYCAERQ